MPECSYCGDSFDDEESLLRHLKAEHEGELGRVDRRRVAELEPEGGGLPTAPLVLAGVILFAVAIVVYVIFFLGGGSSVEASQEPGAYGTAHEHGRMEMVVLGEEVDFGQGQYQVAADRFHFEGGNGEVWHTHAEGVTLEWAMASLGIGVTEDSVTFEGTTYNDSDPDYDVIVEVNGEPVDPSTHVLQGVQNPSLAGQGDHVRIEVRQANDSG